MKCTSVNEYQNLNSFSTKEKNISLIQYDKNYIERRRLSPSQKRIANKVF